MFFSVLLAAVAMRFFPRTVLTLAVLLGCPATMLSHAQPGDGPVYARQRADGRSGGAGYGGHRLASQPPRYFRGYRPFQPVVAGSWYTRPYPYHFDYYRQRYGTPPQGPDRPCEETPWQY